MAWSFSPYVLPSFLAGLIAMGVGVLAWDHRSERTGRPFVVFMAGVAWWAIAYGIELGFDDLSSILLWDKVAFVGSVAVPAAFFWLAVEYAGYDEDLPGWTPAAILIEPILTLVLVWRYPASRLVWESVTVTQVGSIVLPVIDFGLWYWVNYAYSFVLVGSALVAIGIVFVRGNRIYRRQSALLIGGAAIPLTANLVYNLFPSLSPFPAIDMTTSAMAFTGVVYGLGLYRFRMLDIAPVARGMLLSEIGDGFVVVNAAGEYVEGDEVGWAVAEHAEELFGDRGVSASELDGLDGRVLSVTIDDTERAYEIRTRPVSDFRDERVGTLLILRDITELEIVRQHEQRVSVMNRILRHNIRNSMNVIRGYSELLINALDGEERRFAEIIAARAGRMVSISEKARHLSAATVGAEDRQSVDVAPLVESVVERARTEFPTASVSLARGDPARALVSAESDVTLAVELLVENAIEHNDREHPTVELSVTARPERVEIAVSDDGPGIPSHELAVMDADWETPLDHGSGLGLWVVHWIVTRSDGQLAVEENEPRGSTVTISLPRADGSDAETPSS